MQVDGGMVTADGWLQSHWAWLGSLGGLSQGPSRMLFIRQLCRKEDMGRLWWCPGCVGPPALGRPRLKRLLYLHPLLTWSLWIQFL